MKLSACWIVKNEAANLAVSINSVKECADELIVVDTGSTDDTVRIAKDCGAHTAYFEWIKDFSAARNFALSLASGDYVIFIDGDEYFSPALKKTDRKVIIDTFEKSRVDALLVNKIEVNADTKEEIWAAPLGRIYRRNTIHYEHRVHEMPKTKNGAIPSAIMLGQYRLMHLWYGMEDDESKLRRNIEILEAEQPHLSDEFSKFNNRAYLLREYMVLDEFDKAYPNCQYLMDNTHMWRTMCKTFLGEYIQRFYAAIRLAAIMRDKFDPKELYQKLFMEIKANYPNSREAEFADLYYQILFDYQQERFLENLDAVTKQQKQLPSPLSTDGQLAESMVYEQAAFAEYKRGNRKKSCSFLRLAASAIAGLGIKNIAQTPEEHFKLK